MRTRHGTATNGDSFATPAGLTHIATRRTRQPNEISYEIVHNGNVIDAAIGEWPKHVQIGDMVALEDETKAAVTERTWDGPFLTLTLASS